MRFSRSNDRELSLLSMPKASTILVTNDNQAKYLKKKKRRRRRRREMWK